MGTGRVPLKVNSKGKKNLECMDEMHAFMQCFAHLTRLVLLKRAGTDADAKCANVKTALDTCAAAAAKRGKQRTTINYHLGRLSRLITKTHRKWLCSYFDSKDADSKDHHSQHGQRCACRAQEALTIFDNPTKIDNVQSWTLRTKA